MQPGRSCPLDYRYAPQVFARAADLQADTLYVIGGLYGNVPALEAVLALAACEQATLVFNGDFNWFNIDDASFDAINSEVLRHHALRGNVETEIASDDGEAGCGCAYPDNVAAADVERSNQIIVQLRDAARRHPALRARLSALPMHRVAQVGDMRVAIVHGDLESLAGWSLAADILDTAEGINIIKKQLLTANCQVVASSHTCLPAAVAFDAAHGRCAVINNGAAGMPNFRDTHHGVITRLSTHDARLAGLPVTPLTTLRVADVCVEALPLQYDHPRWQREFAHNWPAGSAADLSYARRISHGPAHTVRDAYSIREAAAHDG